MWSFFVPFGYLDTIHLKYNSYQNVEWQGIFYLFLGKDYHHFSRPYRMQRKLLILERFRPVSIVYYLTYSTSKVILCRKQIFMQKIFILSVLQNVLIYANIYI